MRKEVTHRSTGLNQLGHTVGLPRGGDVHKVHVRGFYWARRPKFEWRGKKYLERMRRIEFLDTHMVGDTAFVGVRVGAGGRGDDGASHRTPATSGSLLSEGVETRENGAIALGGLLRTAASGMVLGEAATFTFVVSDADKRKGKITPLFCGENEICRGRVGSIEEDATSIVLEVESFRIVRNGQEHCRKIRNGGSRNFAMY